MIKIIWLNILIASLVDLYIMLVLILIRYKET